MTVKTSDTKVRTLVGVAERLGYPAGVNLEKILGKKGAQKFRALYAASTPWTAYKEGTTLNDADLLDEARPAFAKLHPEPAYRTGVSYRDSALLELARETLVSADAWDAHKTGVDSQDEVLIQLARIAVIAIDPVSAYYRMENKSMDVPAYRELLNTAGWQLVKSHPEKARLAGIISKDPQLVGAAGRNLVDTDPRLAYTAGHEASDPELIRLARGPYARDYPYSSFEAGRNMHDEKLVTTSLQHIAASTNVGADVLRDLYPEPA